MPAPNHVFESVPQAIVAKEKTVSSVSQLFGSFLRIRNVISRRIAPYAPSPTSIAKKSEK